MRPTYSTAAEHLGWLALLVVSTALTVRAQTPPVARNDAGAITVRGCLQAGADHTTLTDGTGTTYLLEHVSASWRGSSFVEVHGEQFSPSGGRGEAALPQVRVSRMRRLSDTCPQKVVPPPSNRKPPLPSAESPTPPYQSPIAPQPEDAAPLLNSQGAGGAPSPGTGNPQDGKK